MYISFLLVTLIILTIAFPTSGLESKIIINGQELESPVLIQNDRNLVPMREAFEKQGASVHWNEKEKSVTVEKNEQIVKVYADREASFVNGYLKKMDVKPKIVKNIIYIPVRFVAESLGSSVTWKKENNSVTIKSNIELSTPSHLQTKYDVIVLGSEPEAISAAIASARKGQKTLLLDKKERVGGLFSISELNTLDMSYEDGKKNLLTRGFFEEFFELINNRSSFDTANVEQIFIDLLAEEENLSVKLAASDIQPIVSGNTVQAVTFKDKENKSFQISGKQFIDSTANADFAALSGVQFTLGQEDYLETSEMMCVTLVFELTGVDWLTLSNHFVNDGDVSTGADAYSAWGFGAEMAKYKSSDSQVRIRGLNLGKQKNGNVLINALQILGINGLKENELIIAREKAEKELPMILDHIRTLPGLENVKISRKADELYVRETRHMLGQYRLTLNDVLENKDFEDRIAFGSYPVDIQASSGQPDIVMGNPVQYSIPFRSIVPHELTNLLVASRSSSYDSLAHGSARVVPVGMVVAEAAGVAAAYANTKNVDFPTIANPENVQHIKEIQKVLNAQGGNLHAIPNHKNPIMQDWSYEGVKFLRSQGIVGGGYKNDYSLNKPVSENSLKYFLTVVNKRADKQQNIVLSSLNSGDLTKDKLNVFLADNQLSLQDFSTEINQKLTEVDIVTHDTAYMITFEFFNLIDEPSI